MNLATFMREYMVWSDGKMAVAKCAQAGFARAFADPNTRYSQSRPGYGIGLGEKFNPDGTVGRSMALPGGVPRSMQPSAAPSQAAASPAATSGGTGVFRGGQRQDYSGRPANTVSTSSAAPAAAGAPEPSWVRYPRNSAVGQFNAQQATGVFRGGQRQAYSSPTRIAQEHPREMNTGGVSYMTQGGKAQSGTFTLPSGGSVTMPTAQAPRVARSVGAVGTAPTTQDRTQLAMQDAVRATPFTNMGGRSSMSAPTQRAQVAGSSGFSSGNVAGFSTATKDKVPRRLG